MICSLGYYIYSMRFVLPMRLGCTHFPWLFLLPPLHLLNTLARIVPFMICYVSKFQSFGCLSCVGPADMLVLAQTSRIGA